MQDAPTIFCRHTLLARLLPNMDTHRSVAPYHAEHNSIELFWAMHKGKVARSDLTLKNDTDTVSDCNGGSTDDIHSESSG